jgi:asparagine synthase (glutamine-hydrolysing)
MSGIVGLINLNKEPVDSRIIANATRVLEAKSPDRSNTWIHESVGLGHAWLNTSPDVRYPAEPWTDNGTAWVASDSCLCAKGELLEKLRSAGREVGAGASDPELLLLCYRTFGDAFARHLVGDFAVAIWDAAAKKLVCARDHLGVRPFFYVRNERFLMFSSDIDAIRVHPAVSDVVSDEFIADFLAFGASGDSNETVFRQIKRLPAAHCLILGGDEFQLQQYWSVGELEKVEKLRYRRPSEYVDHYESVLEVAVTERLPAAHFALELSGGMDSSSIAAIAASQARSRGLQLTAYTNDSRGLVPQDCDEQHAEIAASYLGIERDVLASEDYPLFDRFETAELRTSEPFGNPDLAQHYDKSMRIIGTGSRVLLTGQAADTLFAGSSTHFVDLVRAGGLIQFFRQLSDHRRYAGSFSGTGLRHALRNIFFRKPSAMLPVPAWPTWLNPEFAGRVGFERRCGALWAQWSNLNDTSGQLRRPWFSQSFESYECLKLPMVARHPFSDIRLLHLTFALPQFMLIKKRVLREAMRGKLPDEILQRGKTGLPGDLHKSKMKRGLSAAIPALDVAAAFIDQSEYARALEGLLTLENGVSTWTTWLLNYPVALAFWLSHTNLHPEVTDERFPRRRAISR